MVRLYNKDTQVLLGTISELQLQFLIDQLEEEASDDQDYYINRATLEMLATAEADPALLDLLQRSLGDREDLEIRWER